MYIYEDHLTCLSQETLSTRRKTKASRTKKMQAATLYFTIPLLPLRSTKNIGLSRRLPTSIRKTIVHRRTLACVAPVTDETTVDYSSSTSVFPAEACETVGGDACDAEMFPEMKPLQQETNPKASVTTEQIDRDYVEYTEPKTVFPGEACDDLGGEFCEAEYQDGVYKDKIMSK